MCYFSNISQAYSPSPGGLSFPPLQTFSTLCRPYRRENIWEKISFILNWTYEPQFVCPQQILTCFFPPYSSHLSVIMFSHVHLWEFAKISAELIPPSAPYLNRMHRMGMSGSARMWGIIFHSGDLRFHPKDSVLSRRLYFIFFSTDDQHIAAENIRETQYTVKRWILLIYTVYTI